MKLRFITIILLFFALDAPAQILTRFNGTVNVFGASGTAPNYSITGFFNDPMGMYASEDVQMGDMIYLLVDNTCARLEVTAITSAAGGIVVLNVTDIDNKFMSPPSGIGALLRNTPNRHFPLYTPNLSETLLSCIRSHFTMQVDTIATGGNGTNIYNTSDTLEDNTKNERVVTHRNADGQFQTLTFDGRGANVGTTNDTVSVIRILGNNSSDDNSTRYITLIAQSTDTTRFDSLVTHDLDGNFVVSATKNLALTGKNAISVNTDSASLYMTENPSYGNVLEDRSASPKGLQYGGDYRNTLVDNSLVPKNYVDALPIANIVRNTRGDSLIVNNWLVKDNDNPENNAFYLAKNLRWINAAVYKQQNALDDVRMMMFGDSKTEFEFIPNAFFRELNKRFIFDGTGFIAVYGAGVMSMNVVNSVTPTTALWTAKTKSSGGRGIGMYSVVSTGSSTAFSFLINTNFEYNRFTNFDVWWYGQVGGGSFEVRVDGVLQATVNTSSATGFQKTTITGLTDNSHSVSITPLGANCELLGFNGSRTGINGFRLHRVGQTGSASNEYITNINADTATWNKQLRELRPSLIWLYLGSNERAANMPLATFKTNIKSLVSYIRNVRDSLDIVLVGQSDFANSLGGVHTLTTRQYNDILRQVAIEDNCAVFDIEKMSGLQAESLKKDPLWMPDGIHEGAAAGEAIAAAFAEGLPGLGQYDLSDGLIRTFGTSSFLPIGGYTANKLMYSNASGNAVTAANLSFDGANLTHTGGNITTAGTLSAGTTIVSRLTSGSGGGSIINNFGFTSGQDLLAAGYQQGVRVDGAHSPTIFQTSNQGGVSVNWQFSNFAQVSRNVNSTDMRVFSVTQGIENTGFNNGITYYHSLFPPLNATGNSTNNTLVGYIFRPNKTGAFSAYARIIGLQIDTSDVLLNVGNGKTGIGLSSTASLSALLNLSASNISRAQLNMPDGVAPTSPLAGDIWVESGVFKYRTGGVTKSLAYINDTKPATEISITDVAGNITATNADAALSELSARIQTGTNGNITITAPTNGTGGGSQRAYSVTGGNMAITRRVINFTPTAAGVCSVDVQQGTLLSLTPSECIISARILEGVNSVNATITYINDTTATITFTAANTNSHTISVIINSVLN